MLKGEKVKILIVKVTASFGVSEDIDTIKETIILSTVFGDTLLSIAISFSDLFLIKSTRSSTNKKPCLLIL